MMFWAEIEDGQVSRVTVSETNEFGADWLAENVGGVWVECNENIGPNYTYDAQIGFIPPKLYDSWVLDEESLTWQAPIEMPDDGKDYGWDEASQSWVEFGE